MAEEVAVAVAQDHHPLAGAAGAAAVSQRSQLVQDSCNIKSL